MLRGFARRIPIAALLMAGSAVDVTAQVGDTGVGRPDRWFVSTFNDRATDEPTARMLYLSRDGTMLIVQCAARAGRRTGGWSIMIRREDWSFPTEFVEGWWSVDSEPPNGPLRWGGSGPLVVLNEDDLRDRLQEPVESRVHFRVARGSTEWSMELGVSELAPSVERFAPTCQVA